MRLTFKVITNCLLSLCLFFLSFQHQILATCGGHLECDGCSGCGGTQTCTTYGTFETDQCGDGCIDITCVHTDDNPTGSYTDRDGVTYWAPGGVTGVLCTSFCPPGCLASESCISETYPRSCTLPGCPTGGDPTPTPTNNPNPTNSPTPTPTPVLISGSLQKDINAAAAGTYCAQSTTSLLAFSGWRIGVTNTAQPSTTYTPTLSTSEYTVNTVTTGNTFTVTLDLSAQSAGSDYVCSCPAPISASNPYLCRYVGVTSPSSKVNFYLKDNNLSNDSWFQVFGGNLFARTGVADVIPYTFCSLYSNCQAALSVPIAGSTNQLSSGFALTDYSTSNYISSSDVAANIHSYLTLANRGNNVNSYAVSSDLNQLNYDYFYKLVENELQIVGNGGELKPSLSTWTTAAWWKNDETNFVKVNGNLTIDETQAFNLTNNQSLVVFIDGNLTLNDSQTADTNYKITSVAQGGFLAFFVNGDILISADVGYELDPANPTVPVVSIENSNIEGVFVTDGKLTVGSKTDVGECCLIESSSARALLWVGEESILTELSKMVGRERSSIKIRLLKTLSTDLIS